MTVNIEQMRFARPKRDDFALHLPALHIAAGERVFLHGPSGSGKSTLLNLIAGVLTGYEGSLRVFDSELSSLTARQRDALRGDRIGIIFQQFNLLPYLSVLENVLLPCRVSQVRRGAVLESESLVDCAKRLLAELGLSRDLFDAQSSALSVGQQQRVAAARALIGRPGLIIADEPTSALDRDNCDGFLELLLSQCAQHNTSVLFVSHDRDLATHFDRSVSLAGDGTCSG
ncbi:MAG: ABC transporter ATP-binding protein [Pseudomonadota bacterium]